MKKPFPVSRAGNLWRNSIKRTKTAETLLPQVVRWKKYIPMVQCREQNTLGHSYTISLLGNHFVKLLRPYVELDADLLLTALLIHDFGEAVRSAAGEDVLWHNKRSERDLEEYEIFLENFSDIKPEIFREYERAFLLQFAEERKDISCFPDRAKKIVAALRKDHPHEIMAFRAVEYWDYVLYAVAHYMEKENPLLLLKILNDHVDILDDISRRLPGFKEEIWTDEIRAWCTHFIAENPKDLQKVKDTMYI